MKKRLLRRFWWILSGILVVGAAIYLPYRTGRLFTYPFITQLGGEERSYPIHYVSPLTLPDPDRYYLFHGPPAKVQAAMKRDLLGQHWALTYEDDEFSVFEKPTSSGNSLRAIYQRNLSMGGKDTCLVTVPSQSNWFEDLVESVKSRLGRKVALEAFDPNWVFQEVDFAFEPSKERDRCVLTSTWRNRTELGTLANIDEIYLNGYEPVQTLPVKRTISAWHKAAIVLTFPVEAAPRKGYLVPWDIEQSSSSSGAGVIDPGIAPDTSINGGFPLDPFVSILPEKGPLDHCGFIRNDSTYRSMEIRNLVLKLGTRKVGGIPSKVLPAGGLLRIPFSLGRTLKTRPTIEITGESRLLPNKRWRPILSDF